MKLQKIGNIYHAQFKTADGKVKSVTTKCTDREQARRVVKQSGLADLEQAARAGRLTQEAISHITAGRKVTMASAVAPFEAWLKSIAKAPKTIINHTGTIRAWIRDTGIEAMAPAAVDEGWISKWINNKHDTSTYQTRRIKLASIHIFFTFLCGRGWAVGNPSKLVAVDKSVLSRDQLSTRDREPFTAEEIKTLTDYAKTLEDPFWHFAIVLSSETGMRLGDIAQLEWSAFSTEGRVRFKSDKRNKVLDLPISKRLSNMLADIPVMHAKIVFPEQRAIQTDPSRRAGLSVQFARMCARLGIQDKSFHCLRHTFATKQFAKDDKDALARKLAESLTLTQIASLLGHSDKKTSKGYVQWC